MKYILVTGGVISGIGKGVIASSIGTILKHCGLRVTSIKIDPYINIDAGTFCPYEHGEVYVLDDGGEVDLDLGNYERFLDITLHSDNNITTGKIYRSVIEKERSGKYLGKTVQVVPHITNAIQEWVESVAKRPVDGSNDSPEVCIIELGGTIGDIEGMPFVEAFRQFQFRVKRENICVFHISLVPRPSATGEHKTKPTQASVREIRSLGLSPDFIVCRSEVPVNSEIKQKVSNFCNVAPDHVLCLHDVKSIYEVPLMLESQKLTSLLRERLDLQSVPKQNPKNFMRKWKQLVSDQEHLRKTVTIALVGKYTLLQDSYASVIKALQHASLACNRRLNLCCVEAEDLEDDCKENRAEKYFEAWQQVSRSQGIIVPGGFGNRGLDGKIAVCKWARTKKIPFLGICLGLQAAAIEFARNVLNIPNANTEESEDGKTKNEVEGTENMTETTAESTEYVVIKMPEFNPGDLGGTMRLGKRKTLFTAENSKLRKLYGNPNEIEERHRHRCEMNKEYVERYHAKGMQFVACDETGLRMEIMELDAHPYFVACQYHPEYLSRPLKPSPPYLGLLLAASNKLDKYLELLDKKEKPSPNESPENSDEECDSIYLLRSINSSLNAISPNSSQVSIVTNCVE